MRIIDSLKPRMARFDAISLRERVGLVAAAAAVSYFAADLLLSPEEKQAKQAAMQARSSMSVSVFNASGASGLAARVLDELSGQGFQPGGSSNSGTMDSSVIYHAPGEEAAAKQVADFLGGIPLQARPSVKKGSVEVYIGKDYKGPGKQNYGPAPQVRLDGVAQAQPVQTADTPSDETPITADGVPCVN